MLNSRIAMLLPLCLVGPRKYYLIIILGHRKYYYYIGVDELFVFGQPSYYHISLPG
jgi:hypothetical protein